VNKFLKENSKSALFSPSSQNYTSPVTRKMAAIPASLSEAGRRNSSPNQRFGRGGAGKNMETNNNYHIIQTA
jgi:hypothetical protein